MPGLASCLQETYALGYLVSFALEGFSPVGGHFRSDSVLWVVQSATGYRNSIVKYLSVYHT